MQTNAEVANDHAEYKAELEQIELYTLYHDLDRINKIALSKLAHVKEFCSNVLRDSQIFIHESDVEINARLDFFKNSRYRTTDENTKILSMLRGFVSIQEYTAAKHTKFLFQRYNYDELSNEIQMEVIEKQLKLQSDLNKFMRQQSETL